MMPYLSQYSTNDLTFKQLGSNPSQQTQNGDVIRKRLSLEYPFWINLYFLCAHYHYPWAIMGVKLEAAFPPESSSKPLSGTIVY